MRLIPKAGLQALHRMASEKDANWWKDLLLLWRPSGQFAANEGLRLAVRNGYLSFYFQGQSIAKVCFAHDGTPRVATHKKYVADGQKGHGYAKLRGQTITLPNGEGDLPYDGIKTLREWIGRASGYKTREKAFVDELVAANRVVLDLEMGLPAWEGQGSALRVDLVTLTKASDGVHLAFWEAKLISDARLRSLTAPAVITQIKTYEAFLDSDGRSKHVQDAYRETCGLLVHFKTMADVCGNHDTTLDEAVKNAATEESRLIIDRPLKLVILRDTEKGGGGNWCQHERKLEELGASFIVLDGANPLDRQLPGESR